MKVFTLITDISTRIVEQARKPRPGKSLQGHKALMVGTRPGTSLQGHKALMGGNLSWWTAWGCLCLVAGALPLPSRVTLGHPSGHKALVSYLDEGTAQTDVQGLAALSKSALRHAPGYFSSMELLLPQETTYPADVLEQAQVAGWRLRWINVSGPAAGSGLQAKIFTWALHEFTEVVFMEASSVFVGNILGPFTSQIGYAHGCKLWSGQLWSNGLWQDAPETRVFAVRPNLAEYERLQALAAVNNDWEEAVFFSSAFRASDNSWCELELEKTVPADAYLQQRTTWDATRHKQVLHFSNVRPWECAAGLEPVCDLWQQEAASNTWPVTVVTSYYIGPSKHGEAKYSQWGRNFMAQKVPMVIFAEKASLVPGIELRDPNLTRVVETGVADFLVSQSLYERHWQQQLDMDPERSIHNIFLFKIWIEKTSNVLRAIDLNAFGSSHYVWMDFGGFRAPDVWKDAWVAHAGRFPTHDRILLLNTPAPHPDKHVGGGYFGGSIRAWDVWARLFYNRLALELRKGSKFVGDDQILMSLIAKDHPRLVCRVSATPVQDDPWFYLQHYLAGKTPADQACSQHPDTLVV